MLHERPNVVIHWQENRMEIKSPAGESNIPLDKEIHVVMLGYPDQEERTLKAGELGEFMRRGYIILQLEFEETAEPFDPEMALARYRELEALMNLEIINNPHWQARRAAGDMSFLRESKNFAAQDELLEEIERNGYTITDIEDESGKPIYEIEPLEKEN